MIELKKHFVQEMEDISFSDIPLSFDTIVQSKSIKRDIVFFKSTIIVKSEDAPFFEYFLEHDQKFMRKILPLLFTDEVTQIRIVKAFASDVLVKRDGKKAIEALCDKRLPAIDRVKTLIGAYSVFTGEGYACVHPLRWFGLEIVNNILPYTPIITDIDPMCSPSIAKILREQFCLTSISVYEEDMDPWMFSKNINDSRMMHYVTPTELFHDAIIMLCLLSKDPEAMIKKFVDENLFEIRTINSCEPLLLAHLPTNIYIMLSARVWYDDPCDKSSTTRLPRYSCGLIMD